MVRSITTLRVGRAYSCLIARVRSESLTHERWSILMGDFLKLQEFEPCSLSLGPSFGVGIDSCLVSRDVFAECFGVEFTAARSNRTILVPSRLSK